MRKIANAGFYRGRSDSRGSQNCHDLLARIKADQIHVAPSPATICSRLVSLVSESERKLSREQIVVRLRAT